MSCWFFVVILVLYLLSEDSTIALYLHFMSIQGNIMFSVTLRNLSPSYDVGHTLSLFLPLPYKKKKKNLSSQFCYKVIRIYPCLCIEPSLLSACIIHIRVSEVMQKLWIQNFSQTLSSLRTTIFRSTWVFSITSMHYYMLTVLILYLCVDRLPRLTQGAKSNKDELWI